MTEKAGKMSGGRGGQMSVLNDTIHAETIKKELRYHNLYDRYMLSPKVQKSLGITNKPTTAVKNDELEDDEFINNLRKSELAPREKHLLPVTNSQEYGWDTVVLIVISYAREDHRNTFPIIEELEKRNYKVHFDKHQPSGRDLVNSAEYFIACISSTYASNRDCLDALKYASREGKRIIPIRFENGPFSSDVELVTAGILFVPFRKEWNKESNGFKLAVEVLQHAIRTAYERLVSSIPNNLKSDPLIGFYEIWARLSNFHKVSLENRNLWFASEHIGGKGIPISRELKARELCYGPSSEPILLLYDVSLSSSWMELSIVFYPKMISWYHNYSHGAMSYGHLKDVSWHINGSFIFTSSGHAIKCSSEHAEELVKLFEAISSIIQHQCPKSIEQSDMTDWMASARSDFEQVGTSRRQNGNYPGSFGYSSVIPPDLSSSYDVTEGARADLSSQDGNARLQRDKSATYTYFAKDKNSNSSDASSVLGIDLGTSFCVAAIMDDNDQVTIIPSTSGNERTPAYVTYTEEEILVGEEAFSARTRYPKSTIFLAKRFIGKNYNDPDVQSLIKQVPFKVVDVDGKPYFEVTQKNVDRIISPEEIQALLLQRMVVTAEAFLNKRVESAVVTVPVYFNIVQRNATKDGCMIAGLKVIKLICEATSASKNVLVVDIGGGTTDVSSIAIDDHVFEVTATAGNTSLGGFDIDMLIAKYLAREFKKKTFGLDLMTDKKGYSRLLKAVTEAKCTLSSATTAHIELESLMDGYDFVTTLSRQKMDELCETFYSECIACIDSIFNPDSNTSKQTIDEVILVGGCGRIPQIGVLVSNYFEGRTISRTLNADLAIAQGAAIQASALRGNPSKLLRKFVLLDAISFAVGVEVLDRTLTAMPPNVTRRTLDRRVITILPQNATFPTIRSRTFTTFKDFQDSILVTVIEGNNAQNCHVLHQVSFLIDPQPAGVPVLQIKIDMKSSSQLTIEISELKTKRMLKHEITVRNANVVTRDSVTLVPFDTSSCLVPNNFYSE
ncbi:70-kilodalton heat shock protein [Nowakowskiella sp. JEL0407]|nr:70-kilodalton heat shock protein [Nowakowskiella sp. JEL0407]